MATPQRPRRRLARINATKNPSYTAASDDGDGDGGGYYSSQTSFGIRGGRGADIASLYRKLGLSGPEDFAIPPAVYAAAMSHLPSPSRRRPELVQPEQLLEDSRQEVIVETASEAGLGGEELVQSGLLQVSRQEITAETRQGAELGNKLVESELVQVSRQENSEELFQADERSREGTGEENAEEDKENGELAVKVEETRREMVAEARMENGGAVAVVVEESSSFTQDERLIAPSPNRRFRRAIDYWIKGRLLGRGSFGSVYEAISDDGFFFAVKEVSLIDQGINANQCIFQLEQEISLLSRLEHENIVRYIGTDKKDAKLYIFLELATQGSLAALYQKYRLQDSQVSAYTRHILNGLNYLHQRSVVHRDIKCANILVDASGVVKLSDFGLAKELTILNQAKSSKGTVYWMAPEVAKARPYGPSADIWSLGCTVLEMLTRRLPYPDKEWTQALFKIGRGIPPPIPNTLSQDARDFITKCVQVNPNDRPSAAQLLTHPFVQRPVTTANQDA